MEWMTDVLRAPTGPEQRRRLRIAPRSVLQFNGLESGRRRRWMENLLHANGSGLWGVPTPGDARQLAVALPAGSATIPIDPTAARFEAGRAVLLRGEDPEQAERADVVAVEPDRVEVATPTLHDWPPGTQVVPLALARLDAMPQLDRFTADATVPFRVAFRTETPLDWPEDAGEHAYRGFPVLEWRPDWLAEPSYSPERELARVDAGTGPVVVYDQSGVPVTVSTYQFVLQGRAQLSRFRSLLYALGGRWGAIWVPTWARDLEVVADAPAGSATLDVEWSGLAAIGQPINRRDLRIELVDGTVLYRRIEGAARMGQDVEKVLLDQPLPRALAAADVRLVSFIALCRQDTDVNKITWWSDSIAWSQLSFRGFSHGL